MRAGNVLEHFRSVGPWVNWAHTVDQFLHGDPEREVRGIACGWIPTNRAIREAGEKGLNLFVTHEGAFYYRWQEIDAVAPMVKAKKDLLQRYRMTVLRCHDTWDRMPEVGIPDAWAARLGFETETRPTESFYKVCLLGEMTVAEAAERVLDKVRPLGQEHVFILGDRDKTVHRMAVGTGAITNLPAMSELGADLILATDDGMNMWMGGHWAVDSGMPILVVNHATAEKPGMMAMARYLEGQFPDVPVAYIDAPIPGPASMA